MHDGRKSKAKGSIIKEVKNDERNQTLNSKIKKNIMSPNTFGKEKANSLSVNKENNINLEDLLISVSNMKGNIKNEKIGNLLLNIENPKKKKKVQEKTLNLTKAQLNISCNNKYQENFAKLRREIFLLEHAKKMQEAKLMNLFEEKDNEKMKEIFKSHLKNINLEKRIGHYYNEIKNHTNLNKNQLSKSNFNSDLIPNEFEDNINFKNLYEKNNKKSRIIKNKPLKLNVDHFAECGNTINKLSHTDKINLSMKNKYKNKAGIYDLMKKEKRIHKDLEKSFESCSEYGKSNQINENESIQEKQKSNKKFQFNGIHNTIKNFEQLYKCPIDNLDQNISINSGDELNHSKNQSLLRRQVKNKAKENLVLLENIEHSIPNCHSFLTNELDRIGNQKSIEKSKNISLKFCLHDNIIDAISHKLERINKFLI